MMKENIAKLLLKLKAISLRPKKPYRFVSGVLSPIYCDNRLVMSYPKERDIIINSFVKIIKQKRIGFDVIAGTATAGIPWASFLAIKLNKPMIYVRKSSKEHGKGNLIEGKLEKGKRVLLVEDLISTGGSSLDAVKTIRKSGGKIVICIVILNYQFKTSSLKFKENNVKLISLTDFKTLVEVAIKEKYINKKDKKILLKWNNNPEKWRR